MTKRFRLLVPLVAVSLMLAAAGSAAEVEPARRFEPATRAAFVAFGKTNGPWAAWIESTLMGSGYERAQRFEQKLYCLGPSDKMPRLLLTQTSSGWIKFWLGPEGLLVAQPVGGGPRIYFPGSDDPKMLEAPRPKQTNSAYHPPHWSLDRCWIFDDALVYDSRTYGGAEYLVGLFRIDTAKRTVSGNRICLEVSDARDHVVAAVQAAGDRILHVGTHLLWENTGWDNSYYPDEVRGIWRTRQLRAFDVKSGLMMSGSEIPPALLALHKESVSKVFGPDPGRKQPLP